MQQKINPYYILPILPYLPKPYIMSHDPDPQKELSRLLDISRAYKVRGTGCLLLRKHTLTLIQCTQDLLTRRHQNASTLLANCESFQSVMPLPEVRGV